VTRTIIKHANLFITFNHLQAQWFYLIPAHLSNLIFNEVSISYTKEQPLRNITQNTVQRCGDFSSTFSLVQRSHSTLDW
jgi:hypothetical protein